MMSTFNLIIGCICLFTGLWDLTKHDYSWFALQMGLSILNLGLWYYPLHKKRSNNKWS